MATGTITPNKSIAGTISKKTVGGTIVTGVGGVSDHEKLTNRDAPNQHPISAIENLSKVLDSKLDSETALPLIEEAVQNKAKGLYFDAKKELAKKSY